MKEHEIKQWLDRHFTQDYQLIPTDKGISNASYLIVTDTEVFVLRVPKKSYQLVGLRFEHEATVLDQVKDLDVPVILFDPISGIKISKYIPRIQEFAQCAAADKYKTVGHMLKILHQKKGVDFYFDPFDKLDSYKKEVESAIVHFPDEGRIIEAVRKRYVPNTLCHNDLVSGNLLFSEERAYLIDYEYAAMNDYRFDIASFFSENEIVDEQERRQFYQGYGIDPEIDRMIRLYECFADILWGYWANMLWEHRGEPIYYAIAKDKERHYARFLKTIDLL